MLLETVKSSAIKLISYNTHTNSFDITFNNGRVYNYTAAPSDFESIKTEFSQTDSVGRTFQKLLNSGKLSVNGNPV